MLQTTSHREYLIWLARWRIEKEREAAERTKFEHYMAHLIAAVKNVLTTKKDKRITPEECFIKFYIDDPQDNVKPTAPTFDELAAMKAAWFARTGYKGPKPK